MVLSIPKFLEFAAQDKQTLLELSNNKSKPAARRKYMYKGYTCKLVSEEYQQSYLLRGWQFGKNKKKKKH
jgi:hypothetical protein